MIRTFLCSMIAAAVTAGAAEQASASKHFTLKVLPLLKEKCFACHGDDPAKIKGELSLLTREAMLKGGGELAESACAGQSGRERSFSLHDVGEP